MQYRPVTIQPSGSEQICGNGMTACPPAPPTPPPPPPPPPSKYATALIHSLGIQVVLYLDDILLLHKDKGRVL